MPTPTALLTNQEGVFTFLAYDSATPPNQRPAGFSAQVAPYSVAYVALTGTNTLHVVPKTAGSFTITINGHASDGSALAPLELDFTASTPPISPATNFVASTVTVKGQDITTPADPGTDTVTGNV